MRELRIYVIECEDLDDELTCITPDLRDEENPEIELVSDEKGFCDAVDRFYGRMMEAPTDARHLLIISCHGKPDTGTWFVCNENTIKFTTLHKHFRARPDQLFVYFSACWGAYTACGAVVADGAAPRPLVAGAGVAIDPKHANHLQQEIISALKYAEDPETRIRTLVEGLNKLHAPQYLAKFAYRFVSRDGTSHPEAGAFKLSVEPIESNYVVTAFQPIRNPVIAMLQDGNGDHWGINLTELRSVTGTGIQVGDSLTVAARPFGESTTENWGALVDPTRAKKSEEPHAFASSVAPGHEFSWNYKEEQYEASAPREQLLPSDRCFRCNWGRVIATPTEAVDPTRNLQLRVRCYRKECSDHSE